MLLSKIGLGTVQFGLDYGISNQKGQTSPNEVKSIVSFAEENKISVLDTASGYGNSEKVLGENDLQRFKIVSKFLPPQNGESIKEQYDQSLINLKVNKLYGYLAHRPLNVASNPHYWEELQKLKDSGLIQKIGFSFNVPEEVEEILRLNMIPDLVQVPFNYFDNRFLPYIESLKQMNCEIHTRSAFLQGLFFIPAQKLPIYFNLAKPIIQRLQDEFGNELSGLLLKYCITQEFIDKVIVGVNSLAQLKDNLLSIKTSNSLPDLHQDIPESILTPSKWAY